MSGVNKVILLGRLGADPETRHTANGSCVTSLRLATSEKWRDKETGEAQERTEWHRVTLFGRLGEVAGEYLRKGSQAYIEGSLRTDKYTDKEGVERYTTKVIASALQLVGGRQEQDAGSSGQDRRQSRPQQGRSTQGRPPASSANNYGSTRGEPPQDDFEDDIPF